ncbi:actin-like ATPase domain-containing protein [Didymella exigua CBS 183.55]|uniref:Actin-like ATPase domain-containing protein n=1 Tax=Didymella exigua CBS 183.55 TaxID=1150837 RepID=A0A6A5RYM0_9PLEO|nr:actin-like ATPase domain-containing protein [Didymella exigua CBS 183.55]KAF1932629.1 actin-like ATPase domain-containing protein [Didymella exigua CBS 183.55]
MPPFKDDQIIVIAPGSETTLAQLGLPESFTPARVRLRSRMFPAEKEGEFEPYKIRRKQDKPGANGEAQGEAKPAAEGEDEIIWEEDRVSEEGAIWPIQDGKITDWPCFFALISHVYNALNPPFHTTILLVTQPSWTPREHEKLAQFFFEKFKTPAFGLIDAALATTWAYGVHTATIVDVGKGKTDVTAVSEFIPHLQGRIVSLSGSGGEAFTEALHDKLKSKGFNRDMCEQLKKSPICEILPDGIPLPGSGKTEGDVITNPASAASTGAIGSGPAAAATIGNAPRGPGPDTEVGEEDGPENEGVLDVASIVAGGKMNEYLAKKEKEKQDKSNAKKKGAPVPEANRPVRLPNFKREKATFLYEDHALLDALKNTNLDTQGMADAKAALDEGPSKKAQEGEHGDGAEANGAGEVTSATSRGAIRREMEVGTERFLAGSNGTMEKIADAIHRAISSVDEVNKRSELWDSLIICGNGSRLRGFKEALLQTLNSKYLISPSSATIFTSEIPSNMSTPAGTGANTPQPQLGPHGSSGVNPLLFAATTAQSQGLMPHGGNPLMSSLSHNSHSSHGQTPTSIKTVKPPEYFPEWKDVGFDESAFLGAQVAAKVIFVVDQGQSKGYMTRPDYNDQGPQGIHDYSL